MRVLFASEILSAPVVLLLGASGAGKTTALGALAAAGHRVGVLDIEGKTEGIQKHRPLLFVPEDYDEALATLEMLKNPTERQRVVQRATDGAWDDIDILGVDSLLEVAKLVDKRRRVKYPRESVSRDEAWAQWDDYGNEIKDFVDLVRDVASTRSEAPIGVVATLGEVVEYKPNGKPMYRTLIKGKQAGPYVPFAFSYVLRLWVQEDDEAGEKNFMCDSVGLGLKGPGLEYLPGRVGLAADGFAKIWECLQRSLGRD